jgi:hypothetical protein
LRDLHRTSSARDLSAQRLDVFITHSFDSDLPLVRGGIDDDAVKPGFPRDSSRATS